MHPQTRDRLLALALLAVGAVLGALAPGTATAASTAASFLHVGPAAGPSALPQILDPGGREVLLKGVNVDGLVDYFKTSLIPPYPTAPASYAEGACPPDDPEVEGVDVCQYDFAQLAPLGYDAIRLNISWSLLEPAPRKIDRSYLARIAQVVGWARKAGIYVVIDMHQDAWSKYVYTAGGETCVEPFRAIRGYDGAPAWASQHTTPACALDGVRELDPAVQEDFQKLYDDAPAPDGVTRSDGSRILYVGAARRPLQRRDGRAVGARAGRRRARRGGPSPPRRRSAGRGARGSSSRPRRSRAR